MHFLEVGMTMDELVSRRKLKESCPVASIYSFTKKSRLLAENEEPWGA